ncbi:MAG TPA: TIGR01777 family oxidoreductase [Kofleriaceae bacterium]|nr:TIGR01777 family oxidoreductase [Kofleriaceae bacterium]
MKVVVTGATGFIGQKLVPLLVARGDEVVVLSRDAAQARAKLGAGVTAVTADLQTKGPWTDALAGAGAVVHLAGESVAARRWDARQKQVIRDSRVETTRALVEAIAARPAGERPAALICSSGTDYYPFADPALGDDEDVTEKDPPGESFLARVCRDWEAEARAAEPLGVRVVLMRTGLVLGGGGGLTKMTTPFKLFAGGPIGSGRQWVSWMHRDDAAAAYVAAVHDERYRGPINLVTDSIRGKAFARLLGAALHRPSWLPVPAFAVKLAAGELAEYILHGRRVVPGKLRELGFTWKYPDPEAALAAALAESA